MKGERHVGGEIRVLSNLIKRCMDDGMPPETTGMQGWIIGFLHRNEDRDMFQRDVEAEFNIRRSTATGILQLMEKNGFLLREPVAYDARLKKLVLTPKALAVHEGVISRIRATEARITKDLSLIHIFTTSFPTPRCLGWRRNGPGALMGWPCLRPCGTAAAT